MLNEMKVIFMDCFLEECILGVFRDKSFSLNDIPKRVKSQERVFFSAILSYLLILLFLLYSQRAIRCYAQSIRHFFYACKMHKSAHLRIKVDSETKSLSKHDAMLKKCRLYSTSYLVATARECSQYILRRIIVIYDF